MHLAARRPHIADMPDSTTAHWRTCSLPSPVGTLHLYASGNGLTAVLWPKERDGRVPLPAHADDATDPILKTAAAQLTDYFAGRRRIFDIPLDAQGTPFQKQVWAALSTIPFGETRSYLDIAKQIGNAAAIRAVGAANGRNPISIIVPCHRVIGSDGTLTGFAGGLETKAKLLALEGIGDRQMALDF